MFLFFDSVILLIMFLLISPKNVFTTRRLLEEAHAVGFDMEVIDVHELAKQRFAVDVDHYDGIFVRQAYPHFNSVRSIAKQFLERGKVVVDANIIDGLGGGKFSSLQKLSAAGISIPKTERASESIMNPPFIAKWIYGFGGKHTYTIRDADQLPVLFNTYPKEEVIVQQYIRADYEYKIVSVGYKSIPVILKIAYDPEKSRPDYKQCQILSLAFHDALVQLAERAARTLGRELAKTDIVEANGKYYVLEVNRWPGLEVFEKYSGYNVAKDFVAYIKSKTP